MSYAADVNLLIQERLERLIDYIENERLENFNPAVKKEWISIQFQIKLRLLNIKDKGDEISGLRLTKEESEKFRPDEIQKLENYRNFNLGFYWLEKDPEKSYKIFNELVESSSDLLVISALNRFAAAIKLADSEQDKEKQILKYECAIKEWEDVSSNNIIPEYLILSSISNYLYSLSKLNKDSDFETKLNTLTEIEKLSYQILPVVISHMHERIQFEAANKLINKAEKIHAQNKKIPAWLSEIKEIIKSDSLYIPSPIGIDKIVEKSIEDYKSLYTEIIRKPANQIVEIMKSKNLDDFLLHCLITSLIDLRNGGIYFLENIQDSKIKENENKLNYFIKMFLRQRFLDFNWNVEAETPQGKSSNPSTNAMGELDIVIRDSYGDELAVVECLWLRNDPIGHAQKIHDYSSINLFYIIVYCENSNQFNWEKYEKKVSTVGDGFVKFEDVPDNNNTTIMVKKALHNIRGSEVFVYHILFLADFAVKKL